MKQAFTDWQPRTSNQKGLLDKSLEIIDDYRGQGYQLTLRQLYYQLVARGIIPNNIKSYKRLGDLISNGRMAGLIDWSDIIDRGRAPRKHGEWNSPADIVEQAANQYRIDRWEGQSNYVEIWCEKDALASVLEPVANRYHLNFLANRGYSSSTAVYDSAQRMVCADENGQLPIVLYLGDHDPSGMDMTRDIRDRLEIMTDGAVVDVRRLALNYDQVIQYDPPPNPTKWTDSRAEAYIQSYGEESWELDALEPQVLDTLVSNEIDSILDRPLYDAKLAREETDKTLIRQAAANLR